MKIGITGHRDFQDVDLARRWIDGIATRHPGATVITGGAIGTDIIFAEQAVKNDNIESRIILPMLPHIFTGTWGPSWIRRLDDVLSKSTIDLMSEYRKNLTYEQLIGIDERSADAESGTYEKEFLLERNLYLVKQSDILIAVYDGRQHGGTLHAIRSALKNGVPVYQAFPHKERKGNKIIYSFSLIEKDEPLADFFKTKEPCIEGYERLQKKIGYENFAHYPLSADIYASNGSLFERHDNTSVTFREEPLAPSNSLIATLKASLNADSDFAKDLARQIEEVGIEHKDYFLKQLKNNPFNAHMELQFLSDGLADLQENPEDVFSRVNVENATLVQAFNDDPSEDTWEDEDGTPDNDYHVVNDPSTSWHRLDVDDSRNYLESGLPLPQEPRNPVFDKLMEKAKTRTPAAGKEIYTISKSGKVNLTYPQWNKIWAEYKGFVSYRYGETPVEKPYVPAPKPKPPVILTALPTPAPTPPPELKPVEPTQPRLSRQQAKKLLEKTQPKPIAFTSEPFTFVRSEKVFRPTAICLNETRLPHIIEIESMIKPKLFDVSNPARYPAMKAIKGLTERERILQELDPYSRELLENMVLLTPEEIEARDRRNEELYRQWEEREAANPPPPPPPENPNAVWDSKSIGSRSNYLNPNRDERHYRR